ncbi:LysR family transcriptional regulator [Companilactobacillus sp.]|jgi:DNA-binding transcriptional LysR family regulator|uniref:LysR family transcriptional regulator n=1 Tax=Companilactobacillus sp. TaxID=2767905 RepID=UPI0025C42D9E|nr:LysR family transcriptional regulator [Companilactobacillus sp.]MCH4009978.1 LysR family transcriptional regulator [Companilactobacillus sp.]MCH4052346.1 LysR family transcriptional regulator [Companilactobacillus sp.]MCH4077920.1 LysR family transcriptional regulator [Companilactobacillus sp.]MCH4126496.1 LysR family transcriptional regulator [Companilactobacillus sp.]MCH4132082.1 LysR family transcriptional regulator [Companilactobacillus sp.]
MRIQQLQYLETIVRTGSINEAAKQLYLTQPSLSNAIKELESEMGIKILLRSKLGVSLTDDGREFMVYARQVLDQVQLLEGRYEKNTVRKQAFSVSAQHYAFVVHAFVELIKTVKADEYNFTLRETETENILSDLTTFKSELGILYLNNFNRQVLQKLFKEQDLEFTPLFKATPHVFVGSQNPLTKKRTVTLEDLVDYPYLSYEQGDNNSFYFSEEILSTLDRKKNIKVSDRATIFNLMVGLNGYTISSGIISNKLNDDKIVAIPLEVDDSMTLGWLKHRQMELSPIAVDYLKMLKEHIEGYGFAIIDDEK